MKHSAKVRVSDRELNLEPAHTHERSTWLSALGLLLGKQQPSVPEKFLYWTSASWKYRGLKDNWGGRGPWPGSMSLLRTMSGWGLRFQAGTSYSLSGLPCPRLNTTEKEDFLVNLPIFLWLLTFSMPQEEWGCFWQYKRKQQAKSASSSSFCPPAAPKQGAHWDQV